MGIGDERVLIVNLHAQVLVEIGRLDEARAVLGLDGHPPTDRGLVVDRRGDHRGRARL